MNGRQSSVSGIFEVRIDNPASKDLTGEYRENQRQRDASWFIGLAVVSGAEVQSLTAKLHAVAKPIDQTSYASDC
jgi:hypothetical protein